MLYGWLRECPTPHCRPCWWAWFRALAGCSVPSTWPSSTPSTLLSTSGCMKVRPDAKTLQVAQPSSFHCLRVDSPPEGSLHRGTMAIFHWVWLASGVPYSTTKLTGHKVTAPSFSSLMCHRLPPEFVVFFFPPVPVYLL